jgi:sugar lactone lactonase YvrE
MTRQTINRCNPVATAALMVLAATAALTFPSATYAVHPQVWSHQAEADYTDGDFNNVIVNNFGELTLGRELKRITTPADIEFVNSFTQTKAGDVYFVTSTNGKVYKIAGGRAVEYFAPPDDHPNLLSIAADAQGDILVGACGETAQLLRISADAAGKVTSKVIFEDPKVAYIWAIRPAADGAIYIATGPHGQVWKVTDGRPAIVLETKAKNVMTLVNDAGGNLIAGTDGTGLVIRIDQKTSKPYVLLDAGAVDITALTTDEAGNIYAAAGQPAEPQPPNVAEEPAAPAKPGKVEPEIPDTAPAPEPVDDGTDQPNPKPEKHNKKNVPPAKKPAASSSGITLPGNGILADNSAQTTIKDLLARIKASQSKGPKVPKHIPRPDTDKGTEPKGRAAPSEESEPDQGNVVYKIAPDGTTTVLMHRQEMVLSLMYHDGEVLIGTGDEGKLYSSKPTSETEALIARVRDENIMAIFQTNDGTIYVGTSNNGEVFTLSPHQAAHGTYVSKVLNAGNAATWGTAALTASLADGAKATIATRTGNVEDIATQGQFWNDWSAEIPANAPTTITSPSARYLQYRVTLEADPQGATPTVAQTRIAYQVQNLPPVLKNLSVDATGGSGSGDAGGDENAQGIKPDQPAHTVHIYWDASDPNHDELTYRVLYRQVGTTLWVQLTKDLKEPAFDWNTREVPDGKYQLKVIASDAADNTAEDAKAVARVTQIITINNTPPVISDLKAEAIAGGAVKITGHADDTVSSIVEVRYKVDGYPDWHPAVASDKIFDSPSEGFSAETRELAAGEHRVTVKATDAQGNVSYKAVMVTVK